MMNNLVGYMVNTIIAQENRIQHAGSAYTYVMAGNGNWIVAENTHIFARIQVSEVNIRGLMPLTPSFWLKHGRIPQRLWDLALSVLLAHPEEERYVGIRWNSGAAYDIFYPAQDGHEASLTYDCGQDIVFEIHSHPGMKPFFSGPASREGTDDHDEQGLKIYGVVGQDMIEIEHILPDPDPSILESGSLAVNLRIGVYGYFHPVKWTDVFEGSLGDVIDVNKENEDAEEE